MKVIVMHNRAYQKLEEMLNSLRLHFEYEGKLAENDLKLLNNLQRYICHHTNTYNEYSESIQWENKDDD